MEGSEHSEDVARFFISKQLLIAGRVLQSLQADPLLESNETVPVFRYTFAGRDPELFSVTITDFLRTFEVIVRSKTNGGEIRTTKREISKGEPRFDALRDFFATDFDSEDFWRPLTVEERQYFNSVMGGRICLYEKVSANEYSAIAFISPEFEGHEDVKFLRNLDSYASVSNLMKEIARNRGAEGTRK